MKIYRPLIVVVERDTPNLLVGSKTLPISVARQIVQKQGVLIWDWRGTCAIVPLNQLANAVDLYDDWGQSGYQTTTPPTALTIPWSSCAGYDYVPIRDLTRGSHEQLGKTDATPGTAGSSETNERPLEP